MPLIVLIAVLIGLRYFEVWRFAEMSWWWVVAAMVAAFIWFEFIEKALGLDKKKEHNVDAERRKARVKSTFDNKK